MTWLGLGGIVFVGVILVFALAALVAMLKERMDADED